MAVFRARRRAALLLAAVSLVATVAGCSGHKSGGSQSEAGGPPPGGWPQADNGNLTKEMCGLLTSADYHKYGHQLLDLVSSESDPANALNCLYMLGDELSLSLQPTAEAAKLVFADRTARHPDKLKESGYTSERVDNPVATADESWIDVSDLSAGTDKAYMLEARRGALLVTITLGGLKDKKAADPKDALAGLGALVLERVPDLGKTDTGSTHTVKFEVVGTGKVTEVSYGDPNTGETVEAKNVTLPWSVEVPFAVVHAKDYVSFTLTASSSNYSQPLGCRITVDGKVVEQNNSALLSFCTFNYTLESA